MKKNQIDNRLESVLLETGYDSVVGIDEVGRGSWAGPVVVSAFVYTKATKVYSKVNDSKLLTLRQRSALYEILQSCEFVIASAEVDEIDSLNIVEATRLAMSRAIKKINPKNAIVLVDGYFKEPFEFDHRCISRGDTLHYSIAAASILAKVHRDNLMIELAQEYPQYGFETNVGYGTLKHRQALEKYGVCEIHRRSYKPIKNLLEAEG